MKDLKLHQKTIKLLEENIWTILQDVRNDNEILKKEPKTQISKTKINKWNYIKLRSFCTAKKIIMSYVLPE